MQSRLNFLNLLQNMSEMQVHGLEKNQKTIWEIAYGSHLVISVFFLHKTISHGAELLYEPSIVML